MKEKEIWKVWHNGPRVIWEVSDQGNVKRNGEIYECRLNKGYKVFCHYSVHRAVAELFIPNPNNYNEVDHINGNKLDNRVINLQWCTHQQNLNNPITRKRQNEANRKRSKSMKGKNTGPQSEEHRRKLSESMKDRHRVYHDDGTWHMEKNIIIN